MAPVDIGLPGISGIEGIRRLKADHPDLPLLVLFRDFHPPEMAGHQLTPHEIRLLKLLTQGHSYKTAATELGVSIHTVWFHLRKIYEKLQVHSKSEAVARAFRAGLVR